MTDPRHIIKHIRDQVKKTEEVIPIDPLEAERIRLEMHSKLWTTDKVTQRDFSFKKAVLVRNQNLEAERERKSAEAERKAAIEATRMKNLKKARRRLRWIRNQETE
jgi:hypothetical protein